MEGGGQADLKSVSVQLLRVVLWPEVGVVAVAEIELLEKTSLKTFASSAFWKLLGLFSLDLPSSSTEPVASLVAAEGGFVSGVALET